MGCDYYIYKYLKINFHNLNFFPLLIQIECEDGYYYPYYLDEDDPNYENEYTNYIEKQLSFTMKPIIIYEQNQFLNSKLEGKYKKRIDDELNRYNEIHEDKIEWKDIIDIKKIETREERD